MENWVAFIQDRWLLILIVAIVLFLVIKLIHAFVKWAIVFGVIAALLAYGYQYSDQLTEVGEKIISYTREEALELLYKEAGTALYRQLDKGFTVELGAFTLSGEDGKPDITVSYGGQSFTIKRNEWIDNLIEKSRNSTGP